MRIDSSPDILRYLVTYIKREKPFSLLRGGDATLGCLGILFAPGVVKKGHWATRPTGNIKEFGLIRVKRLTNLVGIPPSEVKNVFVETIAHLKRANYIDGFPKRRYKREHFRSWSDWEVVKNWGTIYRKCGIDMRDKRFCDPRFNYFVALEDQYNLLEFLEGRRVFCICNSTIPRLDKIAKKVGYYTIPENVTRGSNSLWNIYKDICRTTVPLAKRYDLFLIGAGFLGRNIAGRIRNAGGRVLDVGSLFDYWSGRKLEIPFKGTRNLIRYNPEKMLFERLDDGVEDL